MKKHRSILLQGEMTPSNPDVAINYYQISTVGSQLQMISLSILKTPFKFI